MRKKAGEEKIKERTQHLLEEIRIVLPGTEALLGFQLVSIFSTGFNELSQSLKYLHLFNLCMVTLATIFLIAPAAFDRIAEKENREFFIKFSSSLLVIALICLSLAISGNLYLVTLLTTGSANLALLFSVSCFLIACALWFGYSFYKRKSD